MQSFDEKLKALLKTEPSFLDKDWELLEWKLQDSARNADKKLIKLLITDEEMKSKFFSEIAWYQVFNGNLFIEYISNKNFLDNSYTKYKNKIWLQINGKFLKENGDVALVRPFKDCVLEWWQSKEDEKKKEIFFNEILAQDEIDKLFAPKVLTNFKKYDKDWEHKVEWFKRDENGTIKDNLIIKWNNLLALHTIKKEFEWKVKLIYIDPPYNTWSDSFWYNDNFKHSSWLTFMKNRLDIAKKLLRDDWAIFIQIDHHELWYIQLLLDDVFWSNNKVQIIAVKAASVSGFKSVNPWPIDVTEYILFYTKNKANFWFKKNRVKSWYNVNYNQYLDMHNSEDTSKRTFTPIKQHLLQSINKTEKELKEQFWDAYKIVLQQMIADYAFNNAENIISIRDLHKPTEKMKELQELSRKNKGTIYTYTKVSWDKTYLYNWGAIAFYSSKLQTIDWEKCVTELLSDFWDHISWAWIANEWWVKLKNGKKPEKLIKQIIEIATQDWDIVLDYHLWSWTTCAVAHKMWRQYIWIEQLNYWENDSVIRLQNVINGDSTGISEAVNWKWWWEFIYCELKKYNQEFIEQIEDAKSTDELLKIRENMKEKAYFKYNFDMQKFEESIDEFKNEDLEKQKELLVEILNKNQLYANLSDIDDENLEVSDEDKKLNDLFYNN